MSAQAKYPFPRAASKNATAAAPSNEDWWANQLELGILHQHAPAANVYATSDAKSKLVQDFVAAWTKVMNLDRFDLKRA